MSLQPPKAYVKHCYSATGTQIIVRVVGHSFLLFPVKTIAPTGRAQYKVTELGHDLFTGIFDECLAFCEAL